MAKKNLPTENRTVKESNACARSRMTGQTRNANVLLKALIAQVKTDELDLLKQYSVEIAPYFNCANVQGLNVKQIKNAVNDLLSIKIFIEIQGKNGVIIEGMVLVPTARYENGIITATFNPYIKEHLTQLKGSFTQFDAIEYSSLPSIYSQKLYEILKSYEHGLKNNFIEIQIDDLKTMLDCPQSMEDYKNFKRLVLNKSFEDINNKTSLKYEWEPVKKGRKVTSVRFKIITEVNKTHKLKALPDKAEYQQKTSVAAKAFACSRKHINSHCPHDQGETCKKCDEIGFRGGGTGEGSSSGLQPAGAILAGLASMMGKEGKA